MGAYAVRFDVGPDLWMTTVGDDDIRSRARRRARLRSWARGVWRRAREAGAPRAARYMMLVTVGGRRESPVLAAETLKPVIDAGTDEHMWPDDDPTHRVMTCYLRDPRPLPGGRALLHVWVIPLPAGDPVARLLACAPGAQGFLIGAPVDDDTWLTSNMRLPDAERKRRQERAMRLARRAWEGHAVGERCGVVCQVSYPHPDFIGDPDNTAETATAMWGAGVLDRRAPATPDVFAFTVADTPSPPHSHAMRLLVFDTPDDPAWPLRLTDA